VPESYRICEDEMPTRRRGRDGLCSLRSICRIGHGRLRALAKAGAAVDLVYAKLRGVDFLGSILLL
jgi:hypothetical protein